MTTFTPEEKRIINVLYTMDKPQIRLAIARRSETVRAAAKTYLPWLNQKEYGNHRMSGRLVRWGLRI